ncbi:hypothetical protein K502DRAFT_319078 [Neoconidiobolus thromboides FSU 785]|nr:hypothetical protein K502DRAFT_319078 [Neoconidiobolus thromboides FSU 785]
MSKLHQKSLNKDIYYEKYKTTKSRIKEVEKENEGALTELDILNKEIKKLRRLNNNCLNRLVELSSKEDEKEDRTTSDEEEIEKPVTEDKDTNDDPNLKHFISRKPNNINLNDWLSMYKGRNEAMMQSRPQLPPNQAFYPMPNPMHYTPQEAVDMRIRYEQNLRRQNEIKFQMMNGERMRQHIAENGQVRDPYLRYPNGIHPSGIQHPQVRNPGMVHADSQGTIRRTEVREEGYRPYPYPHPSHAQREAYVSMQHRPMVDQERLRQMHHVPVPGSVPSREQFHSMKEASMMQNERNMIMNAMAPPPFSERDINYNAMRPHQSRDNIGLNSYYSDRFRMPQDKRYVDMRNPMAYGMAYPRPANPPPVSSVPVQYQQYVARTTANLQNPPPPVTNAQPINNPNITTNPYNAQSATIANKAVKPRRVQPVPKDKDGNIKLPLQMSIFTVLDLGRIEYEKPGYHSNRYLYPIGFKIQRYYKSTIDPEGNSVYTLTILEGRLGPKFQLEAQDSGEVFHSETLSGAWGQVIKLANNIRKVQVNSSGSGPELSGFAHATISWMLQSLKNAEKCKQYIWQEFEPMAFNNIPINRGLAPPLPKK